MQNILKYLFRGKVWRIKHWDYLMSNRGASSRVSFSAKQNSLKGEILESLQLLPINLLMRRMKKVKFSGLVNVEF